MHPTYSDTVPAGDSPGNGQDQVSGWFKRTMSKLRRRGEESYIEVTMLGNTGVGKTTMLASMYDSLDDVVGNAALDIVAEDRGTSRVLAEYLSDLRGLTGELRSKPLPGTPDVREYVFDVGRRGKDPLFKIRFTDYPGRYFVQPDLASATEAERIQRALTKADVVIVAIDAAALMERDGAYNEQFNTPKVVFDSIRTMLRVDTDRLVILAPLKCEKYVGTPEGAFALEEKIRKFYQRLLNYMATPEIDERVGCVLTPVQSIGSVAFNRIDTTANPPEFVYVATGRGAPFAPKDTDQPLRYALKFIVGKYRETAGPLRSVVQKIMGTDLVLLMAMQNFSEGCKTTNGFSILHPHRFLRPWRPQ